MRDAPDTPTKTNPRKRRSALHLVRKQVKVGDVPGMTHEQLAQSAQAGPAAQPARISVIDYGGDRHERRDAIDDLPKLLADPRPDWVKVRWVNIEGLHDAAALAQLAKAYDLHPLAMEDVVNAGQRAKAESYGDPEPGKPRFFMIAHMLYRDEFKDLVHEQVSLFLGMRTVITIQERPGDVWGPVRERIKKPTSRFYRHGAGYLAYALLDSVIDAVFPLLEGYADRLEAIEERILVDPDQELLQELHGLKRELMLMRREVWPMRDMIRTLLDMDTDLFDEATRLYLRDAGDHTISAIELIETYREVASGLGDAWMTAMSNRMNEVMKVLTIIASMFIPISFLAGVFGMNFENMPMLAAPWGFRLFVGLCAVTVVGMWVWFRRKGWI